MTGQALPLLVELGCEELPADAAPKMAAALLARLQGTLTEAGLSFGKSRWMGTPRRLVAHIEAVQERQPDRIEELTGPPAKVAFDEDGKPTRAGLGFARGQGLAAADLFTVQTAKGPYAGLRKEIKGEAARRIVAEALPNVLRGLPQPKKMRWQTGIDTFIRPVRWLVALLGDDVIEAAFCGQSAGPNSRGHRFTADRAVPVTAALDGYLAALRAAGVEPDHAIRKASIIAGARALADDAGGTLVEDSGTIETVTWLVESAHPLLASFDKAFLAIPDEVILTALKSHQKLLCVRDASGALMPHFVAVANTLTETSRATVMAGNSKVVSARLADARFFYSEDGKQPLAHYAAKLSQRTWLQQLGTMAAKVERISALATAIGKRARAANMSAITRGALLCKADLQTRMVGEFPGLQGVIGADYARRSGEPGPVAAVIAEHYLPRFAGDALPASEAGAIVAVADRLDSIVGCFGIGLVPTGAQDPYALRRAALGVLHIVAARSWAIGLGDLLSWAINGYGDALQVAHEPLKTSLQEFFRGRLKAWHQQRFGTDIVDAVLAAGFDAVTTVQPRIEALAGLRATDAFEPLAITFKRVGNIVAKAAGEQISPVVDTERLEHPAEQRLARRVAEVQISIDAAVQSRDYQRALQQLTDLREDVDAFFDDVMVMAEDPALRRNRLALMSMTGALFAPIADFRRIQAKK